VTKRNVSGSLSASNPVIGIVNICPILSPTGSSQEETICTGCTKK